MKQTNIRILLVNLSILLFSSCSLLELSMNTNIEPLDERDLNSRIAVRAFYTEFTESVIVASDSIVKMTTDQALKRQAIRWKMLSTSACTKSAFQTSAELSLIDTWILCEQMEAYFHTQQADSIFMNFKGIPLDLSTNLNQTIEELAISLYPRKEYKVLRNFVKDYAVQHPVKDGEFPKENTLPQWVEYLEIPDTAYIRTIGNTPQVMNDLTERVSVYNLQLQNQLTWQKDLLMMDTNMDSLSTEVFTRVDTLTVIMNQMKYIAETSPEKFSIIMDQIHQDWGPVLSSLDSTVIHSFEGVARERAAFQIFVDEQRALMVEDVNRTGDELIKTTTESLATFIRKISWVIILLIIVLSLVIVGVPIFIGYTLARLKYKPRKNEKDTI